MVDFTKLEQEITNSLSTVTDLESLNECRIKYLGKKGEISLLMKELANLSGEDRKKQAEIFTINNCIFFRFYVRVKSSFFCHNNTIFDCARLFS